MSRKEFVSMLKELIQRGDVRVASNYELGSVQHFLELSPSLAEELRIYEPFAVPPENTSDES